MAYIISEKAHEISDSIVGQMDRGVTVLPGKGAYSGENKLVLMCAFKQKEIVNLKEIIFEIDPKAFIIVCDAHEVTGKRLQDLSKERHLIPSLKGARDGTGRRKEDPG